MSLYDKMTAAWANRDGQAYLDLHHEDFQMTWHTSINMNKLSLGFDSCCRTP